VSKVGLGRLVDPALLFAVAPVCKVLLVPPVRKAKRAKRAFAVIARLVMPAQLVLEVPPAPQAQPDQLACVAPHWWVPPGPPAMPAPPERKAKRDTRVLKAALRPALLGQLGLPGREACRARPVTLARKVELVS
jgi:hypothetical protein